jgi:hypothetical protein
VRLAIAAFHAAHLVLTSFFLSRGSPRKDRKRSDHMDETQEPRIGHADRQGLELQEITTVPTRWWQRSRNSLTPAECKRLELDEHQRVREIRMFFQHASDANFTGTVGEITGRKVWGFVSRMDTQRDVSSEAFYLEPVASG